MTRKIQFWLGISLVCAIGVGLSMPAFLFFWKRFHPWTIFGMGLSLTSFLIAYLLANFRHAGEVEKLVFKRTAELEEANRRLKEMGKLKDEFIAHVSHELRTPMGIVREGVSQVLEGIYGGVTPKQAGTLSLTLRNIDRLGRLIEDLLDISKMESGKLAIHKEDFDLTVLVKEIVRAYLDRTREKGLRMKTLFRDHEAAWVYADREKVAQVLSNLLDNALKFTQKGFVEISVERKEIGVLCSVSDTGDGIAGENLPMVFEKFRQFNWGPGPGSKGTGLGLAICKKLVELQGGTMWVESRLNEGSRFIFTLPVRDATRRRGPVSRAA